MAKWLRSGLDLRVRRQAFTIPTARKLPLIISPTGACPSERELQCRRADGFALLGVYIGYARGGAEHMVAMLSLQIHYYQPYGKAEAFGSQCRSRAAAGQSFPTLPSLLLLTARVVWLRLLMRIWVAAR